MADPRLFRLRVTFRETGRLAMLSHLELARALERAVRRAQLPFAVSQGFSPHMRIAFGAALPVGVGGTAEFFDVFLTTYVAPDKALRALQDAGVEDLGAISCSYVEPKAPAASVACPISTYEAVFDEPPGIIAVPETVTVTRKKKEKVLAVGDFLVGKPELDNGTMTFTLEAKPTGSLRPDVFVSACVRAMVELGYLTPKARVVSLTRTEQRAAEA